MLIADTTLTCSHAAIPDGRAGDLLFTLIFLQYLSFYFLLAS